MRSSYDYYQNYHNDDITFIEFQREELTKDYYYLKMIYN